MNKHKTAILKEFKKLYPEPKSELDFKNKYQLLVAVMLSAQCTDKKVNQVTPILFSSYPSFKSLREARLSEVEKIIRPINYYKTKSKHLIAMADKIKQDFKGRMPLDFDNLITLPGVGRKTAQVIQCELGTEPALPVDTHVFRVSKRLVIAEGKNPDQVEKSLKQNFDPKDWHHLHHWLIFHGRRVCKAQRPMCQDCSLAKYCPSFNKP